MRSLSLDQLQTLREVVKLGSFSAAARRLNLTQPAVSLQVRELEARCGVRLIERCGKSVRATDAGTELISYAERIGAEAENALAAMRRYHAGCVGRVRLGTGPTALSYLLPPILQRLRDNYPDIDLVITTGTTNDIAEQMQADALDLGFTALPVAREDFVETPVRTDPMVAILPATDTEIPTTITPADVERRRLILEYQRIPHTQLSRAWLRAAGVEVRPALELNHVDDIKQAVAAGLGMALIPGPAVTEGPPVNSIVVRPLDPPLVRTLGLIQRRSKLEDPALRAVRHELLTLANVPMHESAAATPSKAARKT